MILLSDPRVAQIACVDNAEPLVDLRDVPELRLDGRLADPFGAYAMLREEVVARLLAAQAALPTGTRLLVVEGYRPPALQLAYFTGYRDELAAAHPEWDAPRRHVEASKYVAPPEVAPHGTGGAVDLTLCTDDGVELDMGTAVNASPEASAGACFTADTTVSAAARVHRAVLVAAMTAAELVNYPTEWWHWSYGDRYWALLTGSGTARYGPVTPPAGPDAVRDAGGARCDGMVR